MVERIRITPSNITTKNASGNITFNTDLQYLKTDATGILKAGGYQKVPTMSGGMYQQPIQNTDKGMFCPSVITINPLISASTSFYYPIARYSEARAGDGLVGNTPYNPANNSAGFKSAQISLYTHTGEYVGYYNWVAVYHYQAGYSDYDGDYNDAEWLFSQLKIANLTIPSFNFSGTPQFTFTDPGTWFATPADFIAMSGFDYSFGTGYTMSEPDLFPSPDPGDIYMYYFYIMTTSEPASLSLKVTP